MSQGMGTPAYAEKQKLEAMEEHKWQHDMFDDREEMPPRREKTFGKRKATMAKL